MKDKRGIIGLLLITLVLAISIIIGFLYIQIRFYGIEMKTGNFIIDVKYSPSEKDVQNKSKGDMVVVQEEEVNSTDNNLLLQINNYTTMQQQLSENYTAEQQLLEE